eukprot:6904395-Lingulodinium_polyedra.AAC.1
MLGRDQANPLAGPRSGVGCGAPRARDWTKARREWRSPAVAQPAACRSAGVNRQSARICRVSRIVSHRMQTGR